MKKLIFIPIILVLTACEPRDLDLRADSQRPKKFSDRGQGPQFMEDFVIAAHVYERQMEALIAFEMSQDANFSEVHGFTFFQSPKKTKTFIKDEKSIRLKDAEARVNSDKWDSSVNDGRQILIGDDFTFVFADANTSKPALKSFNKKSLIVKEEGNEFELTYDADIELRRDGGRFYDEHGIKIHFTMKVQRNEASKTYTVLSSAATFSADKMGDPKFTRFLYVDLEPNFIFDLKSCVAGNGKMKIYRKDRNGEKPSSPRNNLEFTFEKIRDIDANSDVELFAPCENQRRPIVDLSRFIR
jgi:hypothetical protein